MKTLALTMLATAGLALTAWQVGRAHETLAPFQITAERTANGVDLQCSKGCAWTKASWSCRPHGGAPVLIAQGDTINAPPACRFQIDERGVGGL